VAPAEAIFLDVKTEAELAELPEDETAEMAAGLGLGEPGLSRLVRAGFHALGRTTFLTAGPKEARAWEIPIGATAPEAAGVIRAVQPRSRPRPRPSPRRRRSRPTRDDRAGNGVDHPGRLRRGGADGDLQARASFGPAVRNVVRPRAWNPA